jgi:hypothetical protein
MVTTPVDDVEPPPVPVTEMSSVPVAPFESVAVMTYVPVAKLEPAAVAYENAPPAWTATLVASTTVPVLCDVTSMKTLSGSEGVGVMVPAIV